MNPTIFQIGTRVTVELAFTWLDGKAGVVVERWEKWPGRWMYGVRIDGTNTTADLSGRVLTKVKREEVITKPTHRAGKRHRGR